MNTELFNKAFHTEDHTKAYSLQEAMNFFWNKNLINVGELAEQAISKSCGVKQNKPNAKGSDLLDGSEIKYATVFYDRRVVYATIGGFKNKTGTIRGWVYEPVTGKNYFFLIPHSTYNQYTMSGKKSTMKIWFDKHGLPRSPTKNTHTDLWVHETDKDTFFNFKE